MSYTVLPDLQNTQQDAIHNTLPDLQHRPSTLIHPYLTYRINTCSVYLIHFHAPDLQDRHAGQYNTFHAVRSASLQVDKQMLDSWLMQ